MSSEYSPNVVKKDGVWTVDGRPRDSAKLLSQFRPSNLPGKVVVIILITLPVNAATPPHTHNGAAVVGLMLAGTTINQMNSDPAQKYSEGEVWYEGPGCHHVRSENVSEKEGQEAQFYAVIICDDDKFQKHGPDAFITLDADAEEKKKESQL